MTETPTRADPATADIAWMRNLAEEGAHAPMRGGVFLLTAGVFYGLASLFHWALLESLTPLTVQSSWIGWMGATVAYWVFLAIAIPRARRTPGVYTAANKAVGAAWSGVGWGIFALFLAMAVLGWRLRGESIDAMFAIVPSLIMVFYGIGWAVSALMHRSRTMGALALGSFIAAPVMAFFAGGSTQYLAYAAALVLLAAVPGYLFMRQASRA